MKMKHLYIGLTAVSMLSVGCQDQFENIKPSGTALSLEQVQNGAKLSAERAEAGIPGLFNQLNAREGIYAIQGDFGYPSFACRLEHLGDNVVTTTHGYNWFNRELQHEQNNLKGAIATVWAWNASYKNIKLANDIILVNRDLREDATARPVLGTAKAMRAWDYFLLAQLFGKTYKGNEQALTVPIVKEDTEPSVLENNPRATNEEIYKFILADLDDAVELMKGYTPSAKNFLSEAVVYGIRSRVHMVMNNWKQAAADAKKAIDLFAEKGGAPYSIADCSIPNFDDVQTSKNAMWGVIIGTEDPVTKSGIANYTSMFTSLCFGSGGYTTMVDTWKRLNRRVWDQIPTTDVRRDWFVHEKAMYGYTSPILKKAYGDQMTMESAKKNNITDVAFLSYKMKSHPLTVVKFAPTNKSLTEAENSVDFMLMRVEEMYYNYAEATAMGGDVAGGAKILTDFVKTYRNPGFNKTFADAKALQDEIYFQKRVEFFGEGISWFDMLRMKKGLDRVDVAKKDDGGYPELTRFNIPAGAINFTWQLPESEEQANKAVTKNNNPAITGTPKDMF